MLAIGARVVVKATVGRCLVDAPGVVAATGEPSTGSMWVELDERSAISGAHPYCAGSDYERWVLAYPEDCAVPHQLAQARCACGQTATRCCAFALCGSRGGTCSVPLCDQCAVPQPGPRIDYCGPHARYAAKPTEQLHLTQEPERR